MENDFLTLLDNFKFLFYIFNALALPVILFYFKRNITHKDALKDEIELLRVDYAALKTQFEANNESIVNQLKALFTQSTALRSEILEIYKNDKK